MKHPPGPSRIHGCPTNTDDIRRSLHVPRLFSSPSYRVIMSIDIRRLRPSYLKTSHC